MTANHCLISVIIPVRNDFDRLEETIKSIREQSSKLHEIEFVIADDASDDGSNERFKLNDKNVKVFRLHERAGVPGARNYAASKASGDILFITDAHVSFSKNWDLDVIRHIADDRILAATICDTISPFKGYGCNLIVPFMGTRWVRERKPEDNPFVQVASSAGTVLTRALFEKIGGFDSGMILYGAAEPEFSLRAWLSGAEIISVPSLQVFHTFKTKSEIDDFFTNLRPYIVHNNLRFGMLYLGEEEILRMVRYYAIIYPEHIQEAADLLEKSEVWQHREYLNETLKHDFKWFVKKFQLKDQVGHEIIV